MPPCDSSETFTRAVRPEPSPADLLPGGAAGVFEVSRFSCTKFLGVSGVFDYAGLSRDSRYRPHSCCLPRISKTSASGLHLFGAEYPPRLAPVYASLCLCLVTIQVTARFISFNLNRGSTRRVRNSVLLVCAIPAQGRHFPRRSKSRENRFSEILSYAA